MTISILRKQKMPFTQIPNIAIDDLSFNALGLYVYMMSKPNNWNFTIKSISSQRKNDGETKIKTAMKELKDSGWVKYIKNYDGTGEYILYIEPKVENQHLDKAKSTKPTCGKATCGKSTHINNTNKDSNKDSNNKKIYKKDSSLNYTFDDFYNIYPNKKSKDKAQQNWNKAASTNGFPKTYQELHHCLLPLIVKANFGFPMKFIKHPSTWLNQGCWNDEYSIEEIVEELTQGISDFSEKKDKKYEIQDFINQKIRGIAA